MPVTYSINVGQIIEAYRKPDIFSVLQDLPDNTQKQISPRDVRDAFLSTWANSAIKITTPNNQSTLEYIGLDSGNPDNRDIKLPILLGKRSFGNLDVMSNSLLSNNDADIFIYNTKTDALDQSSTKVAILSGTSSALHLYAPYLESYATGSTVDFNIHNPSLAGGAINIFSSTGRVSINGIVFPTAAETGASASNGRILRYSGTYPSGYLRWDDATLTLTSIGTPGFTTSIYGSPVLLNGYNLEFVDNALVPVTLGGVTQGSSFSSDSFSNSVTGTYSDWPLVEVMRKILYPYIEPVLELSVYNTATGTTYAEVGTTVSIAVTFSVTTYARDNNEYIFQHLVKEYQEPGTNSFYFSLTFSDIPGSVTGSFFTYSRAFPDSSNPATGSLYLQLAASNNSFFTSTASFPANSDTGGGFSYSTKDSITWLSPFALSYESFTFSMSVPGFAGSTGVKNILTGSANKLILPYDGGSQSFFISKTGSGYLYFVYPSSYGPLNYIKDPNGFILHDASSVIYSAFTFSQVSITPVAPFTYYGSYNVYRTTLTCSHTMSAPFEFIF